MTFPDVASLFLQSFLEALIPLVVSLAAAWLLPKVIEAWKKFKAGNPDEVFLIEQIAAMAVHAAEQEAIAGYIEDRKEYALTVAEAWLAKYGIKMDVSVLAAIIEAAVKENLNPDKRFAAPE